MPDTRDLRLTRMSLLVAIVRDKGGKFLPTIFSSNHDTQTVADICQYMNFLSLPFPKSRK